ncbi:MAG: hypothetical protein P4L40_16915 [Terracidiphilus sp.]|nr:hypothetical protein [Terracidiphilus sp.]
MLQVLWVGWFAFNPSSAFRLVPHRQSAVMARAVSVPVTTRVHVQHKLCP